MPPDRGRGGEQAERLPVELGRDDIERGAGQLVEHEGDIGRPALVELGEERVVFRKFARDAGGTVPASCPSR
jgi:hypothetical protein